MFNNLTRIVDIVKEEAQKIINLDTSMIAIYNNFHLIDNKDEALKEYIGMLEIRKNTSEIEQVQVFLSEMITALNKHKVGMIDNYTHKKRIKSMKAQCDKDMAIEIIDEVEAENVEIKPVELPDINEPIKVVLTEINTKKK